jgi:hypothetical protein
VFPTKDAVPARTGQGGSWEPKAFHVRCTSYIVILGGGGVVVYTGFGWAENFGGALRKVAGA